MSRTFLENACKIVFHALQCICTKGVADMKAEEIGENIKNIRKRKRITQEELAKAVGVNRATIARYESGGIQLSMEMAARIAEALDCEITEIISLKKIISDTKEMTKNIQNAFASFQKENIELMLLTSFRKLNYEGQKKSLEYTSDLSKISEYQKRSDEQPTDTTSDE